jgi:hypothetical protein
MVRAILCALLVVAATPLAAQEQKQPQAPRPVQIDVALALVLAVDVPVASAMIASNCRSRATQRHSEIDRS